ncbi:unnamed protein product, partial [Urochloa humidicola]
GSRCATCWRAYSEPVSSVERWARGHVVPSDVSYPASVDAVRPVDAAPSWRTVPADETRHATDELAVPATPSRLALLAGPAAPTAICV